jgi:heterodisulfide reductase subunit A
MNRSVLVIGAGMTGLQAAAELCEGGALPIVVERGPVVGGRRASWLSGETGIDPRLSQVHDSESIEILTLAELQGLTGAAGAFTATIRQQARFVSDDCTRCNHCVPVCPQVVSNEFDAGLTFRKAIHTPSADALPGAYTIDIESCLNVPPNYLPCQRCVEVCDDNAIHFDMLGDQCLEREIAAVIIATGFGIESLDEATVLAEFGYARYPDILSAVELQRMLENPGPSGGYAIRPSNEAYPDSVLLVLTRLSVDSAWVIGNQVQRLLAQDIDEVGVLVLAAPGSASELDELEQTLLACGAPLNFGSWIDVGTTDSEQLQVRYAVLPTGETTDLAADMVVLSSEIYPEKAGAELANKLGLELDERGYPTPSTPGIYVAGGALGTVGVEAATTQARQVVAELLKHIDAQEKAQPSAVDATQLPVSLEHEELERLLHRLMELGECGAP